MKPILCQWMCPAALKLVEPSKELLWSNSHLGDKSRKVFVGRTLLTEPTFWSNSHLPNKIAGDCEVSLFSGAPWLTSSHHAWCTWRQVFGWPLSMWVHLSAWIYLSSNDHDDSSLKIGQTPQKETIVWTNHSIFRGDLLVSGRVYFFLRSLGLNVFFFMEAHLWNEWKTEVARWFEYDRKRWYFFWCARTCPEPWTTYQLEW